MKEMSKSVIRRQGDPNFLTKYFVGKGVDIGGYPDPLSLYTEFFPLITEVRIWDWDDGDAQEMDGVENDSFDFVTSSHCLEHLIDPFQGLQNWLRILKPGGHLVVTIPEEDLYEQGVWPSTKNLDHKHSFTILKSVSWALNSVNVLDLIRSLGDQCDVRKIEVVDRGYRYKMPNFDQTLTPTSESAIEFIIRKRKSTEISQFTMRVNDGVQPPLELRKYFNQYGMDMKAMKSTNQFGKPFSDDSEI
jgi:SAM-dependent methyltransferase